MVGIADITDIKPDNFALMQNYPNPFNPGTRISYNLPVTSQVDLTTLFSGRQTAGLHYVNFDAGQLPGGVYLYRLDAGLFHDVKKMILIK